jgi:riboflavin synthase
VFTGIVTTIGTVHRVAASDGVELDIAAPWTDLEPGESVAVDGACLTVTTLTPAGFGVHVTPPTLARTRFAQYAVGQRVNLERALRLGDRLGGHLVQGHVDGIGRVVSVTRGEEATVVDLEVPEEVARFSVPRGSIAVDGVSLTVAARPAPRTVRVALIPFTLQHTTLDRLAPGAEVHVEGDLIGRYLAALLEHRVAPREGRTHD